MSTAKAPAAPSDRICEKPYQNVKSIQQAVFKLLHSQAISCIGYNVNLPTAVAAILFFVLFLSLGRIILIHLIIDQLL